MTTLSSQQVLSQLQQGKSLAEAELSCINLQGQNLDQTQILKKCW